jgi:hypothetical protein
MDLSNFHHVSILLTCLALVIVFVIEYTDTAPIINPCLYTQTLVRVIYEQEERKRALAAAHRDSLPAALAYVNKLNMQVAEKQLRMARYSYVCACKALGWLTTTKQTKERNLMMGQINRIRMNIAHLEQIAEFGSVL